MTGKCSICQLAIVHGRCFHCDEACPNAACPVCRSQVQRSQHDATLAMSRQPHPTKEEMAR